MVIAVSLAMVDLDWIWPELAVDFFALAKEEVLQLLVCHRVVSFVGTVAFVDQIEWVMVGVLPLVEA